MCINRFLYNSNANVIVLCNLHYKHEYNFNKANENKIYWHIRHAMLSPVKSQHFLLDFENYIDTENIQKIILLLQNIN